ncbi:MAG: FliH/SctL family protein [Planctomycetota bacterium]
MSTIIRASDAPRTIQHVAFNFDDMTAQMAAQAEQYLKQVRAEAAKIVAQARQEADAVRTQAEQQGRQAALQAVEATVQKQLATVIPALTQVVREINHARQAFLRQWEACGVHVAAAIARKLVRRELTQNPEIAATWLREALELASGSGQLRVRLHPDDFTELKGRAEGFAAELGGLAAVDWLADPDITRGGCRVETRFGSIDQQLEAQLVRIEEELT